MNKWGIGTGRSNIEWSGLQIIVLWQYFDEMAFVDITIILEVINLVVVLEGRVKSVSYREVTKPDVLNTQWCLVKFLHVFVKFLN